MSPNLAKALRIVFGASATEIAYRYGFDVDMDGVIAWVEFLTAAVPFAPVGLVPLTPGGSTTEHSESRVLPHRESILAAIPRQAKPIIRRGSVNIGQELATDYWLLQLCQ
jgi:hypothetical protein